MRCNPPRHNLSKTKGDMRSPYQGRYIRLLLTLATAALCGNKVASADSLPHVNFGTDWVAEAEHGGYYEAEALALYAQHGLTVSIRPGGPQINSAQLLMNGKLEFAIISSGMQVLNIAKENVPIVAVAAFYQKSPLVLMVHEHSGIHSISDIRGHAVMASSYARYSYWPWLERQFGFTDEMLRPYTFNLEPFLVDPDAVQQAYLTSEPFTVRQSGEEPRLFLLADYGFADYAAVLVVRRDFLEKEARLVERFVAATRSGWRAFLHGDPTPAFEDIEKRNPQMTRAAMEFARNSLIKEGIIESGDAVAHGIGAMSAAQWTRIAALASDPPLPRQLVIRSYDLQFANR